jgi:hypothetical protein
MFSLQQIREHESGTGGGEMAQIMYTHVSKCKQ